MLDRLGAIIQKFRPTGPSSAAPVKPSTSEDAREATHTDILARASQSNITLTPQSVTETRPLSAEEMREVAALQNDGRLRMRWNEETQQEELVPSGAGIQGTAAGTVAASAVTLSPLKVSLLEAAREGLTLTELYTRKGAFNAEMTEAVDALLDSGLVEKRSNPGAVLEELHLTDKGREALG